MLETVVWVDKRIGFATMYAVKMYCEMFYSETIVLSIGQGVLIDGVSKLNFKKLKPKLLKFWNKKCFKADQLATKKVFSC